MLPNMILDEARFYNTREPIRNGDQYVIIVLTCGLELSVGRGTVGDPSSDTRERRTFTFQHQAQEKFEKECADAVQNGFVRYQLAMHGVEQFSV
jgi:hypothetical protein